ncbi:MAG: 4Fe-4S dicluster domain-containing protein [Bacteroidetes bacterium]|jgi:Fe-S-cluster-containing dehydrogenase component|nr:4Fe-4S dicluster domain-containing protein [Bacteroidota bacterium]MBT6687700.1 4Fe-4S dicluster domain-containing protein [Bacteroidota bacterium]MBT7143623.1 4Fe-4S dicluster domain-containing protein [Bacteroidota bacterium]MBT7490524.1 4Fe-4S dicluster domain-containing protein [Bacteroidota bacterium]
MIDKKEDKGIERRKFLKKMGGLAAGSVAAGCVLPLSSCSAEAKSGEKIAVLSTDGKVIEVDKNDIQEIEKAAVENDPGRIGLVDKKFVMVIDLAKCRNARECMKSCQSAHQLHPDQHHINVLAMQDTEKTAPYYLPKPCQHCDNPPCVAVCPVDATFKRQDGIVLVDNERCIGCRFCMAACPYSARTFNWFEPKDAEKYKDVEYDIEKNVPQKKGTVTKCCFSADKLRNDELPYCVTACPNGVYYFGDSNENAVTNGTSKETVSLSELLKKNAAYQLMDKLGTKPSVYYLPPKNRMFEFEPPKDENNS